MMLGVTDLWIIFYWIFIWNTIGFFFYPLSWYFFRDSYDHGYSVSRWLGALVLAYAVWILGSLRFGTEMETNLWVGIAVGVGLNGYLSLRFHKQLLTVAVSQWRYWLLIGLAELLLLIGMAGLRSLAPDLNTLEKFMDLGLVQTSLRSTSLPPQDPWQAGMGVNYYYFGHFFTAVLAQISKLEPSIVFNLMIATLVATSLGLVGSLSIHTHSNKGIHAWWLTGGALMTAWLLGGRSNLHALAYYWQLWTNQIVNGLPNVANDYWFADATRFIPQTVHEFPSYSFIVADLHAHVLNLPSVLLLLWILWIVSTRKDIPDRYIYVVGWLVGVMAMTNTWDAILYGLLSLVVFGAKVQRRPDRLIRLRDLVLKYGLTVSISSGIFWQTYQPPGFYWGWVTDSSPGISWLVQWGWDLAVTILGFGLFGILYRTSRLVTADKVVSGLYFLAWLLIGIPEILYVETIDPILGVVDLRANLMFKLGYQAWVLLSLAHGYTFVRMGQVLCRARWVWWLWILGVGFSVVGLSLGTGKGVLTYYTSQATYQTLKGDRWLLAQHPEDWEIIQWLTTLPGQPVILEASGDSYSYAGRISAYTGFPTVQGWLFHEWHWRGGDPGSFIQRQQDVATLYNSRDKLWVQQLLQKYNVSYIVVGELERRTYDTPSDAAFLFVTTPVFESGTSAIYRVHTFSPSKTTPDSWPAFLKR